MVPTATLSATGDKFRSIPAVELREVREVPNVEFHLLDDKLDPGDEWYLNSLPNLHLITTVYTSIAQLAGALALPTWLLLSTQPYCLWMSDRSDLPWYPIIRLFRQSAPDAWGPVVAQTAAHLPVSCSDHPVQS